MERKRENDLGRLILKLANTIIRNRNRHLARVDLTCGQADALQYFLAHSGATVTDWKREYDITHQTASGIVKRACEKGLLTISPSERDARQRAVFPTPAGVALGETMRSNRERTGGKLLDRMTAEEQAEFIRLLGIAYENVKED